MKPIDRFDGRTDAPTTTTASAAYDPYDADRPLLLKCGCGADHAPQDHGAASTQAAQAVDEETLGRQFMEAALVKALFPQETAAVPSCAPPAAPAPWPRCRACCPLPACKPWRKKRRRWRRRT
jgi:hypothetical protein